MVSKAKRKTALVPAPEKFAALLHLVNLLPKALRRSPASSTDETVQTQQPIYWSTVRFQWYCREEKEAIHSIHYLRNVMDDLPPEMQAFILKDDLGRIIETASGRVPTSTDVNFQTLENFSLLGRPSREQLAIIAEAKERINHVVEKTEAKLSSRNRTQQDFGIPIEVDPFAKEIFANLKFVDIPLSILANRARQRLIFILAAEEILDALVAPDPHKKLNQNWYINEAVSARGFIYVENDQVREYPPLLFSFLLGVQVSRIKRCGICGDYFWAGRKDKKVCSARCGATSRKRQERQRYFEKKIGVRKRKGK